MLTPYELLVVAEIADHIVRPNLIQRALAVCGRPVSLLLDRAQGVPGLKAVPRLVHAGVEKSLKTTIGVANHLCNDDAILAAHQAHARLATFAEVIEAPLEAKDRVADGFNLSNALILAVEGAVMGLATTLCEGLPGAQLLVPSIIGADIAASMTFLSRHVCQVATSYGYSSQHAANLPHLLAAMAPHSDPSEDGYLTVKAAVLEANKEAVRFVSHASKGVAEALRAGRAPALVRLIQLVAERLGLVVTEKELGMLVPVAGALLNGSVNVAFQQLGHVTAKDYFRRLHLDRKYGEATVAAAIDREVRRLRES